MVGVGGRPHLVVRAGAATVSLRVILVGWFSDRAEAGTSGLFNRLSGQSLAKVVVRPRASRTVVVAKHGGLPAAGASALLLRASTSSKRPTGVGFGATAKAAKVAPGMQSLGGGATTGLVLVRVSKGRIVLVNSGRSRVTVDLSGVGWFTSGNPSQYGDVLTLSASPRRLLAGRSVGAAPTTVTTSGVGDIPSSTKAVPPSLVLWRAAASSKRRGSLKVGRHDLGYQTAALSLVAGGRTAGLVLAEPDATGATDIAASAASRVDVQAYAWFSGGLRLADNLRILDAATTSAVSAVDGSHVAFTGIPQQLQDVAVGDILNASSSAEVPGACSARSLVSPRTGATWTSAPTPRASPTPSCRAGWSPVTATPTRRLPAPVPRSRAAP